MRVILRSPPGALSVLGAGAVSAHGLGWRGLGEAIAKGSLRFAPSRQLEASHGAVLASEAPELAPADDAGDARQRKLMSRPARLAAVATRLALAEAGASTSGSTGTTGSAQTSRTPIGAYLGVGASAAAMAEVQALLDESIVLGRFSLPRCGERGLGAVNPLFTFQLMSNFGLCHAAMLEGLSGPNAALFSRGGGTVVALIEAAHAVASGECERAVTGGADSAMHPVTWAELVRDGRAAGGLVPGEGAAILVIGGERASISSVLGTGSTGRSASPRVLGTIDAATLAVGRSDTLRATADAAIAGALEISGSTPIDQVVLAPWGREARAVLFEAARAACPLAGGSPDGLIDVSSALGDALAAAPALAWLAALDRLASRGGGRALVLSAGIDGDVGAVVLGRTGALEPRGERMSRAEGA